MRSVNLDDLPAPPYWRGYAPVWAVLGLGLAVSVLAAVGLREEARRTDAARFAGLVEQTRQNFDNITEKYQHALQRLADAIGARETFTEKHWNLQVYWLSPDVEFPGLSEIQIVRVALETNLPPALEELDGDDFRSGDAAQTNRFRLANAIRKRAPVRLEPLWSYIARSATQPDGQGAPGDSLKQQLPHVRTAIQSQTLRVTGRRVILRHKNGQEIRGTTLIIPIPGEALARGWSTNLPVLRSVGEWDSYNMLKVFAGLRYTSAILCGSIDWQLLLHSLLRDQRPELHLNLYANPKPKPDYWLGGSGTAAPPKTASAIRASFRTNAPINMYSSKWTLAMHTTPAFDDQSTQYRAYVALLGGTVVTMLMVALLAGQIRARVRQQAIADELRQSLLDLEAARAEREELGRDLHDGAIQSLYALQLGLSRTATQTQAAAPEIAGRLADYRRGVSGIIGELRRFILSHEADTKSGADLCRVLTAIVSRVKPTTSAELNAQLDAGAAARLNNEQAVHLANIAREALSNSLRHGSPTHIKVALGSENGTVQLEIHDDGCGFDPAGLPSGGMGLANMSIRAREAGGELKVETAHGRGTRVVVRVAACASAGQASDSGLGGSSVRFDSNGRGKSVV